MNADETRYIFISYSHLDKERIFPALDAMRKRGYRIRYDADIQAGTQWTDELADSIDHCAVFMPFVSGSYGDSEYCMQEIRYAAREKKPIVPVFLTDKHAFPGKLNYQLKDWQGVTFTSPDAFAAWLDKQTIFRPCRAAALNVPELVTDGNPLAPSPYFVGREDKLAEIEAAFRDGAAIVDLYGMGGLGKSEICRKFFRDRVAAFAGRVGWLTWRGSLQSTLYAQFRDIQEDNAPRYLERAREYVNRAGRGLLIILDNADGMTPQQAAELSQLQCRFLVTSRRKQERFRAVYAGTLTPEQCRILYRRALNRDSALSDDSPDAALDEIIRLAAGHTLTVELLAKTQRAAGISAAELLAQLQETRFDLNGEDIEYLHNPETAPEDMDAESPFIGHMSRIFDLSQLRDVRKGAEALRVLQGMSLLAPNEPIVVRTVKEWLDLPNLNGLNKASDLGWLDETTEPDGARFVAIHPVVAAVVRHTSPPDADYTDAIAGRLYKAMCYENTELFTTKLPILKHAEALYRVARTMDLQTEPYAGMLHQMGYLNYWQGNYARALEWNQKALRIRERVLGTDHLSTAAAYNNIAAVYDDVGDYARALEWLKKALNICERVLGTDHPLTATTYHNIAVIYWKQEDYTVFLEWLKKALNVKERVLGTDHPDTALTYVAIALFYREQGDYASALEWLKKALPILENVLSTDHPHTATAYNNIAAVYDDMGDYASALEWLKKALNICEHVFGKDHPSTAIIYHNIGANYFAQGDFREALQWMNKALAIFLNVLGAEHPNTKNTQSWIDAAQRALSGEEQEGDA